MEEIDKDEFERRISRTHTGEFCNLIFEKCVFTFELAVKDKFNQFNFSKCIFEHKVEFSGSEFKANAYFGECVFKESLSLNSCKFRKKARFHKSHFQNGFRINNATFYDLADFWSSIFDKVIIFYKTDFLGTTVFSNVTFYQNALFTYTLIEKLVIFSGTIFNAGLDLSLSILAGELSPFGIKLGDFISEEDTDNGLDYDLMVSNNGLIPDKNKRETFRILKNYYQKENNHIDYLPYARLEVNTLTQQLKKKVQKGKLSIRPIQDYIILGLNSLSNNHGKSYFRGILFTMLSGWLFFYFSLMATETYSFGCDNLWESFEGSVKYYFSFLTPTHKTNHMDELSPKNWFYVWDFLGRAVIAYGIYQTIQAFRKFKK